MAYSGSGRVNIVSLTSGEVQLVENDSQAYILSEPSIITVQGAPSQVSAWQRQESDLILHREDGVSRFQQFFSTDPQSQSQLIFQDGAAQQQARFAHHAEEAGAVVTLTPVLTTLPTVADAVDSTLTVNSMPAEGANAAAAVATTSSPADNGLAAESPASTSEKTASTLATPSNGSLPALTINPVSGDDAVNYKEGIYGVEITGTCSQLASGSRVELTLDGKSWSGYVNNNAWSVQIDDASLAAIKDGSYHFSVSATDALGSSISASRDLLLISHYNSSNPLVTTDALTLADVTYENGQPIYTLTGTMQTPFVLTMFAVKGEIESYRTGTLNADGSWSVQLTSQDLHTEQGQNSLVLGVQDGAGNWFEQMIYVATDLVTPVDTGGGGAEVPVPVPPVENPTDGTPTTPDNPGTTPPDAGGSATPKPTINTPFGDGWLNHAEKTHSETLSGTTGVTGSGQQVVVNISGTRYQATVADDGKWSLTLTSAQLMGKDFATGKHWINVYATNAEGETGKAGAYFFTDVSTPHVSIDTLPNSDINLNSALQNGLVITGKGDAGDGLTLTLGAQSWQTLVGFDGTWRVEITPQQAQQLHLGNYTLKASVADPAKNSVTETQDITFYNGTATPAAAIVDTANADVVAATPVAQPQADSSSLPAATALPHPTIATPFGDGWLNRAEKLEGQTLTGTTGAVGSAQTVMVKINSVDYQAAVTDDGNWRLDLNTDTLMHSEFNTGKRWITVTASNAKGETGSTQAYFFTDVSTPQTSIDTPATGTHINLNQLGENYLFTGKGEAGDSLTLTLGALTWHTTVNFDGTWQTALTPQQVQQLSAGDYTLQATITDMAKNTSSSSLALDFYKGSTSPTVTINNLPDDNRINLNTLTHDYAISGTGEPGARVSVAVGSLEIGSAIVGKNGEWQTWLSESSALELAVGKTTIVASVNDSAGHSHTASLGVEFYTAEVQPTLTMDTVELNDIIDFTDYQNDIQLHGDSWGLHTNTEVTVTLGDKTYTGYVNGDYWIATLPSKDIEAMADGYYNLKVSVESAGGSASASRDVLLLSHIYSSDPVLTFNALTPEDVVYHGDEAYYLVSGTITEPLPVDKLSFYGGELLNYYDINVAANGTFTSEVRVSEYMSDTAGPGFYVSYQDAAGHWYKSENPVTLPDAPAMAETAEQNRVSLLAEDNPLDDVSHASVTGEHGSAVAMAEGASSGSEHSASSHGDSLVNAAGTEGNDTFTFSTLNLLGNLNGGAGHDTLVLSGSHEALDFASLGLKIGSVETIDLGSAGSNSVTLGQHDLLTLTDNASEALTVKGADGSAVTLSTTEGGVWSDAGVRTIEGQAFELYHNTAASHEGTLADILIQHNLQVQTA